MKNLKLIVKEIKSQKINIMASNINDSLSTVMFPDHLKNKIEKFSHDVSVLAYSDEFLDELDSKIGMPLNNETEDEFVDRSKKIMKNLLLKKFKK